MTKYATVLPWRIASSSASKPSCPANWDKRFGCSLISQLCRCIALKACSKHGQSAPTPPTKPAFLLGTGQRMVGWSGITVPPSASIGDREFGSAPAQFRRAPCPYLHHSQPLNIRHVQNAAQKCCLSECRKDRLDSSTGCSNAPNATTLKLRLLHPTRTIHGPWVGLAVSMDRTVSPTKSKTEE
jgi:hypothetical protein